MGSFARGQKIRCVHAFEGQGKYAHIVPVKGYIYTVRDTGVSPLTGIHGLWLHEIIKPPEKWSGGYCELGWVAKHFVPVEEDNADISIFRRIDSDVFEKVNA